MHQNRSASFPLVSILTPSFNQRHWLVDTLDSVAHQTYPHLEHVVVDGGSTDGSVELIRSTLPAESWVSEPDQGQSNAINKAFARSHGEIIGWLNSDDAYLFTDAVERVVAHFDAHPEVDVVYGHAALAGETGRLLHVVWAPRYSQRLLRWSNYIAQPTVFMRRRVLERGFLDESLHYTMDHELWVRLAQEHTFSRVDFVVAIDRHQPGRKVYLRPDLVLQENVRLADAYGLPSIRAGAPVRLLWRMYFRLRGAATAIRLSETRKAFAWSIDGRRQFLVRQLVVKRRFMTTGEAGPA